MPMAVPAPDSGAGYHHHKTSEPNQPNRSLSRRLERAPVAGISPIGSTTDFQAALAPECRSDTLLPAYTSTRLAMNHRIYTSLSVVATISVLWAPLASQQLRRAVTAGDLIAVARSIRVIPAKNHVLYRMQLEEILRGPKRLANTTELTIVTTKRISVHNRPSPAKKMLVCLHDFQLGAQKTGLPKGLAPYFKMSGHSGSAVILDTDSAKDPRLEFARILTASQKGASPRLVAERLFTIAVYGDPRVRIEAANALAERTVLASYLTQVHLSTLLTKATGELADIPYKIALSEVCVVRRAPAVIPTLCVSVEHLGDVTFLEALGRFTKFMHKDSAADVLMTHVKRAKGKTRERLIHALGATSTQGALDTLLSMLNGAENRTAVEAGLRAHGSARALQAIRKNTTQVGK